VYVHKNNKRRDGRGNRGGKEYGVREKKRKTVIINPENRGGLFDAKEYKYIFI